MIEPDTIELLRECDAGVKMGTASIDEVLPHVKSEELHTLLSDCKQEHNQLQNEIQKRLDVFADEGKKPNPIAKGMSWMKTNVMLGIEHTDATIADLMTDGCNMGVKSLAKYLNQCKAADEKSKDIAKRLIALEDTLAKDMRGWL